MHMTDSEIIQSYARADKKKEQIQILAELNLVTKQEMVQWLSDHGVAVDKSLLQKGPKKKETPEENATTEATTETTETTTEVSPEQKADAGKPRLTLVPMRILFDIAEIREYGNQKYPDGGPDNWKRVEEDRYWEAAFRHFLRCVNDHKAVDPESGIRHFKHLLCNLAFIAEMEKEE